MGKGEKKKRLMQGKEKTYAGKRTKKVLRNIKKVLMRKQNLHNKRDKFDRFLIVSSSEREEKRKV